ncbi:MAG: hypothetical protein LBS17_05410 [Actinomycetes bacterium]|jgi:hypothetical protein|nr:hypothetical protein [Actinomycetes bacterium]
MTKKKSALETAQAKAKRLSEQTNKKIEELGGVTNELHKQLTEIQNVFDEIRGIPAKDKIQLSELKKVRLEWKHQVEKIEADYKEAEVKAGGFGAAGAGAGIAVAALGPTVAMGVATTFGVASTGTAISTLSGAAATNAALAWLGGGALAAGGGGMAGGQILLALAGPVGWAIAGVSVIGSGILLISASGKKNRLEKIFINISNRDSKSFKLAIVELEERINRIENETKLLSRAIVEAKSFGTNYDAMTEQQQYELISFVNLMNSSTQLLVNPILGLQPKFTNEDLDNYFETSKTQKTSEKIQNVMVALGNLLFKIKLDDTDKKVLWKAIRDNMEFLKTIDIKKKDFEFEVLQNTIAALELK